MFTVIYFSLLDRNDSMITKIIIALEEFTVLRWGRINKEVNTIVNET